MRIYTIYKITNKINNKSYIGFTGQTPQIRFGQHICSAKKMLKHTAKRLPKFKPPLYCAFNKYGVDQFLFEVIYQSLDKFHTLNEMEGYFIKLYDSYENGYNMSFGGEGHVGRKQSKSEKSMRGQMMKEISKRPEVKEARKLGYEKTLKGKKFNVSMWTISFNNQTEVVVGLKGWLKTKFGEQKYKTIYSSIFGKVRTSGSNYADVSEYMIKNKHLNEDDKLIVEYVSKSNYEEYENQTKHSP